MLERSLRSPGVVPRSHKYYTAHLFRMQPLQCKARIFTRGHGLALDFNGCRRHAGCEQQLAVDGIVACTANNDARRTMLMKQLGGPQWTFMRTAAENHDYVSGNRPAVHAQDFFRIKISDNAKHRREQQKQQQQANDYFSNHKNRFTKMC